MKKIEIELISFGNELLIGEIVDTNSQWLASKLSKAGAAVTRMLTINDDLDDISTAFTECLNRSPDIIITTGGLGPTWDDQTLIGLGKALNKEVTQNELALDLIIKKYKEIRIELSDAGKKMANMPMGSTPLFNRIGTAPGVMYQAGSTTIFCLPGIPDEMKVLFEDHISPFVIQKNPEVNFYEKKFVITGSYESKIAKITQSFTDHYPTIYIKSHPQINRITLHLTTYGYQSEMNLLENVTNELINELSPLGTIEKIDIPPKVS